MPHKHLTFVLLYISIVFASLLPPNEAIALDQSRQQALQRLKNQLTTGEVKDQRDAALKLSDFGDDGIPPLIEALKTSKDQNVLGTVADSLGVIGANAVPFLIDTLHDENSGRKNILVLRFGANALKRIAERLKRGFPEAVPELMRILENRASAEASGASDEELQDSDAAADCLAYFGKDAKQAVPLLIELLPHERNRKSTDRYHKINAVKPIIDQLRAYKDFSNNDAIIGAFEQTKVKLDENDRTELTNAINLLKTDKALNDWQILINPSKIFVNYPTLTSLALISLFGGLAWLALFLFRPLWLLRIYEFLPTGDAHVSGILGTFSFPIRYLWGACTLRPRVLDAWVETKLDDADRIFSKKKPVRERRIYVPLPASLDGRMVTELTPKDLRETFERSQSRILISGPGGCGKTSLAFQIAYWAMRNEGDQRLCPNHAMLPILLESDLSARGEDALREEIATQLSDLLDPTEKMSQSFLTSLLSYKRILVLVDGMSEFNDEVRGWVISGLARSLVKAVVFTSRTDETIGHLNRTSITPTNIKKNQLLDFVGAYLNKLGKRELFKDEELFSGCSHMSRIVGEREITVLLAELFVQQMVAKQEGIIVEDLPQTIPDVFLSSIDVLHGKIKPAEFSLSEVTRAACIIAWECVRQHYWPVAAEYEAIELALAQFPNRAKLLAYLSDRLGIIEFKASHQKVGFRTDPLAEYLAAIYVTRQNDSNSGHWRRFLSRLSSESRSPESIRGFIIALQDCCAINEHVPQFVFVKLMDLLEPNSDAQKTSAAI